MSWDGNTVSVTKRCVALEDCFETGCSDMDHEGNRVREIKYNSHYASSLCHAHPTEIHPHLSSQPTLDSPLKVIFEKTCWVDDKHFWSVLLLIGCGSVSNTKLCSLVNPFILSSDFTADEIKLWVMLPSLSNPSLSNPCWKVCLVTPWTLCILPFTSSIGQELCRGQGADVRRPDWEINAV